MENQTLPPEILKKLNSTPWPNLSFVEPGSCPRCSGAMIILQEDELPQHLIKSHLRLSREDVTVIRAAYAKKKEHPFMWFAARVRYAIIVPPIKMGRPCSRVNEEHIWVAGTIRGDEE